MKIDYNKYINTGEEVKYLGNDLALKPPTYSCYHRL